MTLTKHQTTEQKSPVAYACLLPIAKQAAKKTNLEKFTMGLQSLRFVGRCLQRTAPLIQVIEDKGA